MPHARSVEANERNGLLEQRLERSRHRWKTLMTVHSATIKLPAIVHIALVCISQGYSIDSTTYYRLCLSTTPSLMVPPAANAVARLVALRAHPHVFRVLSGLFCSCPRAAQCRDPQAVPSDGLGRNRTATGCGQWSHLNTPSISSAAQRRLPPR